MGAAGAYRPAALRGRVAWSGAERTAFCSAGRSAPVDGVSGVLEVYTWYSAPLFLMYLMVCCYLSRRGWVDRDCGELLGLIPQWDSTTALIDEKTRVEKS